MISWMQKHNKYLVWTIWIATIAFIGAGFVGWGSYNLGSKAGNVARVGDIEIKQSKLNQAYSNLYSQYNQMMQGKLDEKKAKELGLVQQAFSTVEKQVKLLNFAKDAGIIVSDKELSTKLYEIKGFQKDNLFNREIYNNYLKSQRLKAKDFEASLKDNILIQKTLALLEAPALPLEIESIGKAMNVADKLAYQLLTTEDINYSSDENKVKSFWETQKENYMTKKTYTLSMVWTSSEDSNVSEEAIKNYYDANSFNYTDAKGKQLTFEEAKEKATKDLKIKQTKKSAQKAYIAFKKGEKKSDEEITLSIGDMKLTQEIWNTLESKSTGDILKPKVAGNQYVTIKINAIAEPKLMTFEQAKEKVTAIYDAQTKKESLLTLATNKLKSLDETNSEISDYLTLRTKTNIKSLNSQESLQFIQKLFTSNKEKGIISLEDKVVLYSIIEQKLLSIDENQTENVKQTVNTMKKRVFESNLIKVLDSKYPTEVYVQGLTR